MVEDVLDGVVDGVPLGEELGEDGFAFGREFVETFVALVFFAPLAGEELLGFEAAEEGVQGAFFNGKAFVGEGLAEGVAVVLGAELGEDGDDEAAAAEFEAEGVEDLGFDLGLRRVGCWFHTVCQLLYDVQCVMSSSYFWTCGRYDSWSFIRWGWWDALS